MRHCTTTDTFLSAALALFTLASCCGTVKCDISSPFGEFRIVRASDNADLLFGPSRIYDRNLIKFYSLKATDSIFYYSTASFSPGARYDSILEVAFTPLPDIVYMRLSNGDIDTIRINYESRSSTCCGSFNSITGFRFNNSNDFAGTGLHELKK